MVQVPEVQLMDDRTIRGLQDQLRARWGSSAYSAEYNARTDAGRDAGHAMLHVAKAAGKLAGALDALDHARDDHARSVARSDAGAAIADLIFCAVRVGDAFPFLGPIEVAAACEARLAEKFPAAGKMPTEGIREFYGLASGCRSNSDGDCDWGGCPQLRDDEPAKSGRYCPLDDAAERER